MFTLDQTSALFICLESRWTRQVASFYINPILHREGSSGPPWRDISLEASVNAPIELIFHEFVSFCVVTYLLDPCRIGFTVSIEQPRGLYWY